MLGVLRLLFMRKFCMDFFFLIVLSIFNNFCFFIISIHDYHFFINFHYNTLFK